MVLAATLRSLMRGDCCYCTNKYRIVSANPFYQPTDKERRVQLRRREWNIWLSSTADDMDLIADWWFWWSIYTGDRGGMEDSLTYLLFIFCCLGTLTWLLELIQLAFVQPKHSWTWLQFLIIVLEDVPQMIITSLINGRFQDLTTLGLFNILTSLYSMGIRLAGELFMNCCYCCERVDDEEVDLENEYQLSKR